MCPWICSKKRKDQKKKTELFACFSCYHYYLGWYSHHSLKLSHVHTKVLGLKKKEERDKKERTKKERKENRGIKKKKKEIQEMAVSSWSEIRSSRLRHHQTRHQRDPRHPWGTPLLRGCGHQHCDTGRPSLTSTTRDGWIELDPASLHTEGLFF